MSAEDDRHKLLLREKERDEEFSRLLDLFNTMDSDHSGGICQTEYQQACHNDDIRSRFKLLDFEDAEIDDLFRDLDTGDNVLSLEEFVHGLRSMQGQAKAKDLVRTQKSVQRLHYRFDKLDRALSTNESRKITQDQQRSETPSVSGVDENSRNIDAGPKSMDSEKDLPVHAVTCHSRFATTDWVPTAFSSMKKELEDQIRDHFRELGKVLTQACQVEVQKYIDASGTAHGHPSVGKSASQNLLRQPEASGESKCSVAPDNTGNSSACIEEERQSMSLRSHLLPLVMSEKEHALYLDGIVFSLPFTVQQNVAKALRNERAARLQYTAVLESAYSSLVGEHAKIPRDDLQGSGTSQMHRNGPAIDADLLENIIAKQGKRLVLQQPRASQMNEDRSSTASQYHSSQKAVQNFQPAKRVPSRHAEDHLSHRTAISSDQQRLVTRPSVPGLALGQNLNQRMEPKHNASTKKARTVKAESAVSENNKHDLTEVRTTTV
eukprot:gnl/MRDRNA2_/MRDRNA2_57326_c0_seq2.p1 gnl/MRDRNA2_/MRDRNA2_57326_c0~~gnl/MRDRNA2_/MRDRNA2_57326_c0_seq2.p1  ORF type:complete len:576 (+),score=126.10 gnl/MRDRNA2_/MRDRNA2_57326_c0_seq2:255-1730(+)